MSDFLKVYSASLKDAKRSLKKQISQSEAAYNSLQNKDSNYARAIRAITDLNIKALEVYESAPNELEAV